MTAVKTLVQMRARIRGFAESLSPEISLEIPRGFSNNIAWNVCHIFVTHQLLCYQQSGLPMGIDDETCSMFKKASSPQDWSHPPDLGTLYPKLTELAESFERDLAAGIFQKFEPYTTSAGVELTSVEEALDFNNLHEGIHLGYAMALRRAIEGA